MKIAIVSSTFGLFLSGCASIADGPAILSQTTASSHAEIETFVSNAMGNRPVSLSKDILRHQSSFTVARKVEGSIVGDPMSGRRMELPHHFALSFEGGQCVLRHQESEQTFALQQAQCAPLNTP